MLSWGKCQHEGECHGVFRGFGWTCRIALYLAHRYMGARQVPPLHLLSCISSPPPLWAAHANRWRRGNKLNSTCAMMSSSWNSKLCAVYEIRIARPREFEVIEWAAAHSTWHIEGAFQRNKSFSANFTNTGDHTYINWQKCAVCKQSRTGGVLGDVPSAAV